RHRVRNVSRASLGFRQRFERIGVVAVARARGLLPQGHEALGDGHGAVELLLIQEVDELGLQLLGFSTLSTLSFSLRGLRTRRTCRTCRAQSAYDEQSPADSCTRAGGHAWRHQLS